MSVLIKGMKMPNHCAMCKFHGRMDDPMISQHWCEITGTAILNPYKERCSDCPLVEVKPEATLVDWNQPYSLTISWDGKGLNGNLAASWLVKEGEENKT